MGDAAVTDQFGHSAVRPCTDIDLGRFLPDAVMLTSFNANASRKFWT
jgi:hypothetical protein